MLMRAWRLRVAPAFSAVAAVPQRSLWGSFSTRGLSSSSDNAALDSSTDTKKRKPETAEERKIRQAREFALLPQLFKIYKLATGHYIVPFHFPIPPAKPIAKSEDTKTKKNPRFPGLVYGLVGHVSDIPWPNAAKGMNFGRSVNAFWKSSQHQLDYPEVTRELVEMGVLQSGETHRQLEWRKQTMPALRVYYDLHSDSIVPVDFIVPRSDSTWPVETRGMRLGRVVDKIRQDYLDQKLPANQLEDLQEVDFSFDVHETTWSEKVLPSLEVFARVNGHCSVPQDFVVPKTEPWPRKTWGLPLGQTVNHIRWDGNFAEQVARDAVRLNAIKVVWDYHEHQWSDRILPSLETHFEQYGHCAVRYAFVVPSEAPWLKEAWGLRLGETVNKMRSKGHFPEQVKRDADRLEAIAFSWDPIQDRWSKKVLPALETFYQIHGHCDVRTQFVVPSEDPWPKETWGLKLGSTYKTIKISGSYAEQRRQDQARLEAIDFPIKTD